MWIHREGGFTLKSGRYESRVSGIINIMNVFVLFIPCHKQSFRPPMMDMFIHRSVLGSIPTSYRHLSNCALQLHTSAAHVSTCTAAQDEIHAKYREKHPKLLAQPPVDYPGARIMEVGRGLGLRFPSSLGSLGGGAGIPMSWWNMSFCAQKTPWDWHIYLH